MIVCYPLGVARNVAVRRERGVAQKEDCTLGGRLALVWNRLYPESKTAIARSKDIQASEAAASWHRQELAIAFSTDDGQTWSPPVVIARRERGGLSYPYLFEPVAGQLWVFTRFSHQLGLTLQEADFAGK